MRIFIGILSGILGAIAGWVGLAALIISLAGPDRDGGTAMGAFFGIGPVGGFVGCIAGVILFMKFGLRRPAAASADGTPADAASAPGRSRISRPFAAFILVVVAGLGWWGWYEFIRSPYLSHGYMTLALQFRLPSGAALPPDPRTVHIDVTDGDQSTDADLSNSGWHGHDGNRAVILVKASLSYKTRHRMVNLTMPGLATQTWRLDLASDPDPTPGYTPWRLSGNASPAKIEMNFRLSADN